MRLLDLVYTILLGPVEPPVADPLLAAAGFVRRRFPDLDRSRRSELARLVYLANMLHLGRHGRPMFSDSFEATAMGPVVPRMMDDLRRHAPRCLEPHHQGALTSAMSECLDEVCTLFADLAPGATVASAQWNGGAWATRFAVRSDVDRGTIITDADIRAEYAARMAA